MLYIGSIYKIYSNTINIVYIGVCFTKLDYELDVFKTKYKTKYKTFIDSDIVIELLEDVYSDVNDNQILIEKRRKHILEQTRKLLFYT